MSADDLREKVRKHLSQKIPEGIKRYYFTDWEAYAQENFRRFYVRGSLSKRRVSSQVLCAHDDKPLYKSLLKSIRDSNKAEQYNQCAVRVSQAISSFIRPIRTTPLMRRPHDILHMIVAKRGVVPCAESEKGILRDTDTPTSSRTNISGMSQGSLTALVDSCSMKRPKLIKEGFLCKAGRRRLSARYQSRLFRLYERITPLAKDYFLVYYHVGDMQAATMGSSLAALRAAEDKQRVIRLDDATSVDLKTKNPLEFVILTKERKLRLRASTIKEKVEWDAVLLKTLHEIKQGTSALINMKDDSVSSDTILLSSTDSHKMKDLMKSGEVAFSLKEGFLEMQLGGSDFMIRYFRLVEYLNRAGHLLCFLSYSVRSGDNPQGVLLLTGAEVDLGESVRVGGGKYAFPITIMSEGKLYRLRSSSRTEAIIWHKELRSASNGNRNRRVRNRKRNSLPSRTLNSRLSTRLSLMNSRHSLSSDRSPTRILADIKSSAAHRRTEKVLDIMTRAQLQKASSEDTENLDLNSLARVVYTAGTGDLSFGTPIVSSEYSKGAVERNRKLIDRAPDDQHDIELKDEIYAQLLRHTHRNYSTESKIRCMLLMALCSLRFKPSDEAEGPLIGRIIQFQDQTEDIAISILARFTYWNLRNATRNPMTLGAVARFTVTCLRKTEESQKRQLNRRSSHSSATSLSTQISPITTPNEHEERSKSLWSFVSAGTAASNSVQAQALQRPRSARMVEDVSPRISPRRPYSQRILNRRSQSMQISNLSMRKLKRSLRKSESMSLVVSGPPGAPTDLTSATSASPRENMNTSQASVSSSLFQGGTSLARPPSPWGRGSSGLNVSQSSLDSTTAQIAKKNRSRISANLEPTNILSIQERKMGALEEEIYTSEDMQKGSNEISRYFGEPGPPRFLERQRLISLSKIALHANVKCYDIALCFYTMDPKLWKPDFAKFAPQPSDATSAAEFLGTMTWLRQKSNINKKSSWLLMQLDPIENLTLRLLALPKMTTRLKFGDYRANFLDRIAAFEDKIGDIRLAVEEIRRDAEKIGFAVRKARQIASRMRITWRQGSQTPAKSGQSNYAVSVLKFIHSISTSTGKSRNSVIDFLTISLQGQPFKPLSMISSLKHTKHAYEISQNLNRELNTFLNFFTDLSRCLPDHKPASWEKAESKSMGSSMSFSGLPRKSQRASEFNDTTMRVKGLDRLIKSVDEGLEDRLDVNLHDFVVKGRPRLSRLYRSVTGLSHHIQVISAFLTGKRDSRGEAPVRIELFFGAIQNFKNALEDGCKINKIRF